MTPASTPRSYAFGDHFAVSAWFLRDTAALGNYMGIVNNGYYTHAGWEIRMGREMGGTSLGGGVITSGHDEAWDVSSLPAAINVWHHVCLVSWQIWHAHAVATHLLAHHLPI
jgi:hypothetical protein